MSGQRCGACKQVLKKNQQVIPIFTWRTGGTFGDEGVHTGYVHLACVEVVSHR